MILGKPQFQEMLLLLAAADVWSESIQQQQRQQRKQQHGCELTLGEPAVEMLVGCHCENVAFVLLYSCKCAMWLCCRQATCRAIEEPGMIMAAQNCMIQLRVSAHDSTASEGSN